MKKNDDILNLIKNRIDEQDSIYLDHPVIQSNIYFYTSLNLRIKALSNKYPLKSACPEI